MKTFRFINLYSFALAAVLPFAALGQESAVKVFSGAAEGYEISLPADWLEISPAVLLDYFDRIAKLTPGIPKQAFQHAYQRTGHGSNIVYPYMFVRVQATGAVREDEFAKIVRQGDYAQKTLENGQSKLTNFISGVGQSSSTYDYKRHLLQMKSRMEVRDVGSGDMISAAFLTSKGTLTFYCYYLESDTDSLQRVFMPAIDSVRIASDFVYVPPASRETALMRFLFYGLIGGGIGVGISFIKWVLDGRPKKIRPGQS